MASTPVPVPMSSTACALHLRPIFMMRSSARQTSAGAAVMAGAEGKRRLDLDGNAVDPDAVAVMRPMHHEAAGFDRLETVEAPAYPVRGRQHLEG